mgnify:CR=1 FL=1
MNTPLLHIKLVDNLLSKDTITTDINVIPHATAVYLSLTQEIGMNDMAREILEISESEEIYIIEWLKKNNHLLDFKINDLSNTVSNKKIAITLLNGKTINLVYRLTITKDDILGPVFFITFNKEQRKAAIDKTYNLYTLKEEVGKLKSNLDKEGKEILSQILKEYFDEENKQLSLEDLVNYEKELQAIQKAFPLLSRREVLLCGLLANDMDLNDIATVTNRSLNSVFVTVHRINKKLDIPNKNELFRILKETINNED